MMTPTEAQMHVLFKAGRMESPAIINASPSVNEVMKIEPPACSMMYPTNSVVSTLKCAIFTLSRQLNVVSKKELPIGP